MQLGTSIRPDPEKVARPCLGRAVPERKQYQEQEVGQDVEAALRRRLVRRLTDKLAATATWRRKAAATADRPTTKEHATMDARKDTAMSQSAKSDKPEPFEKNLARLDAIVQELEDTDLPLDKALVLYEEGMKLSEFCHQQLEEAEGRVEILTKKAGGKVVAEPFATDETEAGER